MKFGIFRQTTRAVIVAAVALAPLSCSGGDASGNVGPPTPDPVASVTIAPGDVMIFVAEESVLQATVRTQRGATVSRPVTWTSSDPSIVQVSSVGDIRGTGHGSARITATLDGVSGAANIEVRTEPPPPPASALHFDSDFSQLANDADLAQILDVRTPGNVHVEPGVGMRYDFQPRPTQCSDQTLATIAALPRGTKEVWFRFRIRFSSNWQTENSNCQSPSPDYKTVLTWLGNRAGVEGGHERFDLRTGSDDGDHIHASVPGYPQHDVVGLDVIKRPGARDNLFDGQWHTIEVHQALVGDNEAIFQLRIDGVLTHNYRTVTAKGLVSVWMDHINIGANRNLGAPAMMRVWWDDMQIWVGDDPGGFNFPAPQTF